MIFQNFVSSCHLEAEPLDLLYKLNNLNQSTNEVADKNTEGHNKLSRILFIINKLDTLHNLQSTDIRSNIEPPPEKKI